MKEKPCEGNIVPGTSFKGHSIFSVGFCQRPNLRKGLINANPFATRLYEAYKPIAKTSVNFIAGILIDLAYGFILPEYEGRVKLRERAFPLEAYGDGPPNQKELEVEIWLATAAGAGSAGVIDNGRGMDFPLVIR